MTSNSGTHCKCKKFKAPCSVLHVETIIQMGILEDIHKQIAFPINNANVFHELLQVSLINSSTCIIEPLVTALSNLVSVFI